MDDPGLSGMLPVSVKSDTSLTFLVPDIVPLGGYSICAFYKDNGKDVAVTVPVMSDGGRLQVANDSKVPVKVTSVNEQVNYAENGAFRFTLLGEGFSRIGTDNVLLY
jgi:hypothetical protein